jgi:hypothetical protein
MEIKVYKNYRAIQYNQENLDAVNELLDSFNLNSIDRSFFSPMGFIHIKPGDWLVYSPYKEKWKKYTDEEFQQDFKTLEHIQNDN